MYNPYVQTRARPRFEIDFEEWTNILVSVLAIALVFTFTNGGLSVAPSEFVFLMLAFGITVGSGFVLHELAHKYMAIRLGSYARYEIVTTWLALTLALGIIPPLLGFNLPIMLLITGATMIYAVRPITIHDNGIISVVGPLVNIALSTLFQLGALVIAFSKMGGPTGQILGTVLSLGAMVNMELAWFNLLPLGVGRLSLDGSKVLAWNWKIWLLLIGYTTLMLFVGIGMGP